MSIAVVGHQQSSPILPKGFKYIRRKSEVYVSPSSLGDHDFKTPSWMWSEYSAWFENPELATNSRITGLYHYRCVLNLSSRRYSSLPRCVRYPFLIIQRLSLKRLKVFLIVGEPNLVEVSVWNQFQEAHFESENLLTAACSFYDSFVESKKEPAELRLRSMKKYYPRNIFVTDSHFGKEWLNLSYELARALDDTVKNLPNNRWGGFVLERIFSLYVEDFLDENKVGFLLAQQTYFTPTSLWLKEQAMKTPLVARIHNLIKH